MARIHNTRRATQVRSPMCKKRNPEKKRLRAPTPTLASSPFGVHPLLVGKGGARRMRVLSAAAYLLANKYGVEKAVTPDNINDFLCIGFIHPALLDVGGPCMLVLAIQKLAPKMHTDVAALVKAILQTSIARPWL